MLAHNDKVLSYDETTNVNSREDNPNEIQRNGINSIVSANSIKDDIIFTDLNNIKELSLCNRQLSMLSVNYIELINLVQLDISDNHLEILPEAFKLLEKLQELIINRNKFVHVPDIIMKLKMLKILKMHRNSIINLPENFGELIYLEDLDLSSNKLVDLPHSCINLNSLKDLCLEDNKFKKIPQSIVKGMRNLQSLNLSKNLSCELNYPPYSKRLVSFSASDNIVSLTFPEWILSSEFKNLENVSLDNTSFTNFDLSEKSESSIKKLSMQQCTLSNHSVQKIIMATNCLEKLCVGNNQFKVANNSNCFWSLPIENLKSPNTLTELRAHAVGIPMISRDINRFVNLSIIDLSYNDIFWLPNEICQLVNLIVLLLNNNKLVSLPDDIGQLSKLKELKVNNNIISQLPNSIQNLNELLHLDLYNNDITSIDNSLIELPNLLGLDLEQNYFSTNELLIRNVHYENLREGIREYWHEHSRANGARFPPESSESTSASSLSRSYSSDWDINEADNYNFEPLPAANNDNKSEENWELSDDSSSEFDPNEYHKPKEHTLSPLAFNHPAIPVFCPADLHQKRTFDQVRQMLNEGRFTQPEDVEGQFEDA